MDRTNETEKGPFPKQRLKPRTYLFISLVHSFVALPIFLISVGGFLYNGETILCIAAV